MQPFASGLFRLTTGRSRIKMFMYSVSLVIMHNKTVRSCTSTTKPVHMKRPCFLSRVITITVMSQKKKAASNHLSNSRKVTTGKQKIPIRSWSTTAHSVEERMNLSALQKSIHSQAGKVQDFKLLWKQVKKMGIELITVNRQLLTVNRVNFCITTHQTRKLSNYFQ